MLACSGQQRSAPRSGHSLRPALCCCCRKPGGASAHAGQWDSLRRGQQGRGSHASSRGGRRQLGHHPTTSSAQVLRRLQRQPCARRAARAAVWACGGWCVDGGMQLCKNSALCPRGAARGWWKAVGGWRAGAAQEASQMCLGVITESCRYCCCCLPAASWVTGPMPASSVRYQTCAPSIHLLACQAAGRPELAWMLSCACQLSHTLARSAPGCPATVVHHAINHGPPQPLSCVRAWCPLTAACTSVAAASCSPRLLLAGAAGMTPGAAEAGASALRGVAGWGGHCEGGLPRSGCGGDERGQGATGRTCRA